MMSAYRRAARVAFMVGSAYVVTHATTGVQYVMSEEWSTRAGRKSWLVRRAGYYGPNVITEGLTPAAALGQLNDFLDRA